MVTISRSIPTFNARDRGRYVVPGFRHDAPLILCGLMTRPRPAVRGPPMGSTSGGRYGTPIRRGAPISISAIIRDASLASAELSALIRF